METLKTISTLWSIAIPATILFIITQFTKSIKKDAKIKKRVLNKIIGFVASIFSFITFFCWSAILFLTFSVGITSSLIISTLISLLLVGILNVITGLDEDSKSNTPTKINYIKKVKIHNLKVMQKTYA